MAINTSTKPAEQLNENLSRPAAAASAVLAVLLAAAAVIAMFTVKLASFQGWVLLIGGAVLCAVAVGVSIQLLMKQVWAQKFLLGFYLVVMLAEVTALVSAVLWGQPEWWKAGIHLAAVILPVLVLTAGVAGLLAAASAPNTRLRYGSMVGVTVGVVAALVMVVNLYAQKNYFHRSMETLGQYSLSERTKKVLSSVKDPLRFTVVYTSTDKAKKTPERRDRVMELLEDAKVYGHKVEVVNVTNDTQKAALIERLRAKLGGQAGKHAEYLKGYQAQGKELLAVLAKAGEEWRNQEPNSFLNMWGLSVETANALKKDSGKLEQALDKVDKGLAGPGLPDYAELAREAKEGLNPLKSDLEKLTEVIKGLKETADALGNAEKRQVATAALQQVAAAAKDVADGLGKAGAAQGDPAEAMKKYVAGLRRTAQLAAATARQLDGIAGEGKAEFIRALPALRLQVMLQGGMQGSLPISQYYAMKAREMTEEAADTEGVIKATKSEYQAKYIDQQLRPAAATAVEEMAATGEKAKAALEKLGAVDAASRKAFAAAAEGKLFDNILPKVKELLAAAEKLPEVKDTSLVSDVSRENIVILETEKTAKVVSFDEAWVLQTRPMGPVADEGEQRTFNADAAIGSRLLSITNEPFATVLIAHFEAQVPPEMARMMPPPPQSDIPARALNALRQRLEDSNFKVKEWNLSEEMPKDDEADAKDGKKAPPRVLLVLPPPPPQEQNPFQQQQQQMPMPGFKPEHAQKVIDAINSGTPAIFLGSFLWPRQGNMFSPPAPQNYAFNDYLRNEWGLDLRTEYLVIPAVTDERNPGRYKFDPQRFRYLALSAFTGQPIGEPLADQRVLWRFACPIERGKDARGEPKAPPKGVAIETVLRVPAHMKATWATKSIERLDRQIRGGDGSYIFPDYNAGDLPPPMELVVAATRAAATPATKDANSAEAAPAPARIVVMGVGSSMMDGYLDQPVPVFDEKGTISVTDPPRADADLVVNSVYWLVGRKNLIAAGPVTATMREIGPVTKGLLIALYCIVLPGAVVGVGGIVLLRRRS